MLSSKDYYIDLINSSKAYKFTSYYHYSGVGFKKAKLNQGIFRKSDDKLVGVLQWGCSAQEGIKLDRYVKEPIDKSAYLELNRFCMADSEGRNSESQAIALGIKWIKANRPDIRLLVSYAGRKEGNYGYIYQATNWEYLGYFISPGFWLLDGQERHQITLWYTYKKHCDQSKPFRESICELYNDVRQTWTKQFIYIQRLDRTLTPASPILPYPKETNEYPICTNLKIYKEGIYNDADVIRDEEPNYYHEAEELLFTRRTLKRNGLLIDNHIAFYTKYGELEGTASTATEVSQLCGVSAASISRGLKTGKLACDYYFRYFPSNEQPPEEIDFEWICEIDGLKFIKQIEIADYCGVTKQAVSQSVKRRAKQINGKIISWRETQNSVDEMN